MPEDEKQPWEELGFKTFAEYHQAMETKFDGLADATATLRTQVSDQEKTIEEQNKKLDAKPAVEKPKEEEDNKKLTEDDYKVKATVLYASLTDEQREVAETSISQLPEEIQAVMKTSFEAKHAFLTEAFPEAGEEDDGSVFGALKKKAPKESLSDTIRAAMANLKGGDNGTPPRIGSGFVPNKQGQDGKKPEVKHFDIMGGLYTG